MNEPVSRAMAWGSCTINMPPNTIARFIERFGIYSAAMGPGFVASIGYMDPGNVAANFAGGSTYGYSLLWVLALSNLLAMFVQALSVRLGIYTRQSLPKCCTQYFDKRISVLLWIVCEIIAAATDVPSIVGAAVGLQMLLGIPLPIGALLTVLVSLFLLGGEKKGGKSLERCMLGFVLFIAAAFGIELLLTRPEWNLVAHGILLPRICKESVPIAVAMLGATVMPHIIIVHSRLILHSATSQQYKPQELFRLSLVDIVVSLTIAWMINSAMMITAAACGAKNIQDFAAAYHLLSPMFGNLASGAFALALIASGISSATVGSLSGQVIVEDFIRIRMPRFARRLVAMLPALIAVFCNVDTMRMMIDSQIVLCLCLPFVVVPLVILNCNSRAMGANTLPPPAKLAATAVCAFIIAVDAYLVFSGHCGL